MKKIKKRHKSVNIPEIVDQHLAGVPVKIVPDKPRPSLTPQLTQLAARGLVAELEALLEDGVDADTKSPNGSSALVLAAKYGQLQAVSILLKHGAETHQEALAAAEEAGHQEIVKCLVSCAREQ